MILIVSLLIFDPKFHQDLRNKVGSLSPVKSQVEYESVTLDLMCNVLLTHSATLSNPGRLSLLTHI